MPAIHENIKHLRQARGLTQAAVADAISVTRQTVSSYESGRTQPDLEMLKRLAAVLQVDLYDILYGGNRLQRRLRVLRHTAYASVAAMLLGVLIHSALLWMSNTYFAVDPGPITESSRQIIDVRFALLDAAEMASGIGSAVFRLGCLVLLLLLMITEYSLPLRARLGWLLGLTVAAFAIVTPWAVNDRVYVYVDYVLPIWRVLPSALLVFLISLVIDLARKRKQAQMIMGGSPAPGRDGTRTGAD